MKDAAQHSRFDDRSSLTLSIYLSPNIDSRSALPTGPLVAGDAAGVFRHLLRLPPRPASRLGPRGLLLARRLLVLTPALRVHGPGRAPALPPEPHG